MKRGWAWPCLCVSALVSCVPIEAAELRVMVFDPTWEAWGDLVALAREFEQEHPGVTVRLLSEKGGGDALSKLKIMLAARQPLDVTWIDVTEFSSFLDDGVLLDLQPYFDDDPTWDPSAYFEGPLDAFRGRDGHLYGLPSTFTPYVMYYNRDIFDREGIPYPQPGWTWEDLRAICKRCTKPGQWGIAVTEWLQALAPWIWQNGGRFLSDEMTRCTLAESEAVAAIQFLYDLFHVDRVAVHATYESQLTRGSFQEGNVALYGPVGYWEVYRFKTITDFRWDVCPLPRGREEATSIALRSYVAIRYTPHPELAYRFIRKLAGEEMSRALARIGNGVPGLKSAAYSSDFLKPYVLPESEHVFLDVLPSARFLPVLANWREMESAVQQYLQGCLLHRRYSPGEACTRIAQEVDAFLARERHERERPRAPMGALFGAAGLLGALCVTLWWKRRGPSPRMLHLVEERSGYAFIAPWAIGFLLLVAGPMLVSFVLAFTVWSPIRPLAEARWAGIDNLSRLVSDGNFWQSLLVTLHFAALYVPLSLVASLGLAVLANGRHPAFRTIFYLPVIVNLVAVGILWRAILGEAWLQQRVLIVPGFVLMMLWNVGVPMLVFLAALQSIDRSLYEAAWLDGAGPWRQFLYVTMPQLTPVILFNAVVGVIGAFQVFVQPFVMTQGGPGNASLFYVLYLYNTAFRFHHMGYASLLAWVLLGILLGLTILLLGSSRKWVHYEADAS